MAKYRLRIPGPCGQIELAAFDPVEQRNGIALIAHPHSLYGGSLDNKVVETLARALSDELGYVAVRLNFRGVGESTGNYDAGNGEVDDVLATAAFVKEKYDTLPLKLVGFSFGAYVQTRAALALQPDRLVLVAPAVNMFPFGAVPANTVILHGTEDDLVPLGAVEDWAAGQGVAVTRVPGADHFFNQSLDSLKTALLDACRC